MSIGTKWDLKTYFPQFNDQKMKDFKKTLVEKIDELQQESAGLTGLDSTNQENWEKVFLAFEETLKYISHLASYVSCINACDAANEEYKKEAALIDGLAAEFNKLIINLKMGLKHCQDADFTTFCTRNNLAPIAFHLKEMRLEAVNTMSVELESLAADLGVNGFSAWDRLYTNVTGKLNFDMHWPDGRVETTPMAQCRSLMQDSDRQVRKSAFVNGNKAWQKVEDICAAALNSLAGTRLLLNKKRGVEHFLDISLLQARISRATLDAMFQAIAECRPFIQQLAGAKAKALGQNKLAWFDCEAPLAIPNLNRYSWDECVDMIEKSFSRAYPGLHDFFKSSLEKNWVESELREGKSPGAFCTGSLLTEESRVFMTFAGSLFDVSTLAHEIGHAFHSSKLNGLRPLQQEYPMTLAESASTFAEMILADGVLSDPQVSDAQKLNVLTCSINHGISFLIDIPIRFNFEKSFHEERMNGEVSVSRLKELMSQAMRNQFGELLEENGDDPYFWASKLHFYISDLSFYNYPYSFGYLLSRGLFEMFKKDRKDFIPGYEKFLRDSGSDLAHIVVKNSLGADLEQTDFWKQAILSHKTDLQQFEELVEKILRV